jgi:hypothetical protein
MKHYFIGKLYILLALFIASPIYAKSFDLNQLECKNEFCDATAEKIDYKLDGLVASVNLITDHFSINIPDKPIRRIVASDEDVIVYYKDDKVLIISEQSTPDIDNISKDLAYVFPDMVFTKTSSDVKTNKLPDKIFMKIAILQKQFYFSKASEVTCSENGDVKYFISNSNEMGFSGSAMVSTPKTKKVFLKIDAEKMDFEIFKKVVLSVKSIKGK